MKLYKTRAEAAAKPVEGKRLFKATLNGDEWYGWAPKTSGAAFANRVFSEIGGRAGFADKLHGKNDRQRDDYLTAFHKLPKSDALAMLDKLRAEIEAKP